jgi:hypothetical protein
MQVLVGKTTIHKVLVMNTGAKPLKQHGAVAIQKSFS